MLGILLIAILLYIWGPITPFTPAELVDWFIALPETAKLSIGTSLLTMLGFLIAFQVGSSNAIKQLNLTYRMSAADEIINFYQDASQKILEAQLFSDEILDIIETVEKNEDHPNSIQFNIEYALRRMDKHKKSISKLATLNRSYSLVAKHSIILSNYIGVSKRLDIANGLLSNIVTYSHVPTGIGILEDGNPRDRFLEQIEKEKYRKLYNACDKAYDYINVLAGGVRGALTSEVISQNLNATLSIVKILNREDTAVAFNKLIFTKKYFGKEK
ncbi:MAG: hypothetical protein RRB22_08035 [Gammaproteobacteria bacterium]|nr:hypothetical protein [Gammaproteobacteria bacterium]